MTINICTTNRNKLREVERILGQPLVPVAIDLDEIQTLDTEEVCRKKGAAAYEKLGQPVLVDDTGFALSALDGFPGALVTWVIGAGTTRLLHRLLPAGANDQATVITAIAYVSANGVETFAGRLEGHVIAEPRGINGFGFDEVFVPTGHDRTLAEMSDAEKDAISPRAEALSALAVFLSLNPGPVVGQ